NFSVCTLTSSMIPSRLMATKAIGAASTARRYWSSVSFAACRAASWSLAGLREATREAGVCCGGRFLAMRHLLIPDCGLKDRLFNPRSAIRNRLAGSWLLEIECFGSVQNEEELLLEGVDPLDQFAHAALQGLGGRLPGVGGDLDHLADLIYQEADRA